MQDSENATGAEINIGELDSRTLEAGAQFQVRNKTYQMRSNLSLAFTRGERTKPIIANCGLMEDFAGYFPRKSS